MKPSPELESSRLSVTRAPSPISRETKKPPSDSHLSEGSLCMVLVARTGFEPVISALRGRCPEPLDERAMLAGVLGLEPRLFGTRIRRVASYTIPQRYAARGVAREGMLRTPLGGVKPRHRADEALSTRELLGRKNGGRREPGQRTLPAEKFE